MPTEMTLKCAKCLKTVPGREYLTCASCKNKYDLNCAQVSVQRFYNTLTPDRKKQWKCPFCHNKSPISANELQQQPEMSNITIRTNKNKKTEPLNESTTSINSSIFGDTLQNTPVTSAIEKEETLTLANIQKLLQANNKSIISELKNIIQNEIDDVLAELRNEIKQNNETTKNKHVELQEEIQLLNNKIQTLNHQCLSLAAENKTLQSEIKNGNQNQITATTNLDIAKTFVLHGLVENQWETEEETHDRVIYAIQDILNIDLTCYIEDISRIGMKGFRRPVRIELMSKKIAKYILTNASYFKNTGLAVSEFLDEQSLRERHLLRAALLSARRKGKHAVIHNNKLQINGKEVNIQDLQTSNTPKIKKTQSQPFHIQKHTSKQLTDQPHLPNLHNQISDQDDASKRGNQNIINNQKNLNKQQLQLEHNPSQHTFRDF